MTKDKEIEIIALEFPDSVRTRVGMYLGSVDNPNVCLREIIDNSVDELYGCQSCNKVDIQTKSGIKGGWYVVADNGRGIPIIMDLDRGITKTELAMTTINAGSKFKGEDISVGMNGTGASAVNATCERFVILSKITEGNYRLSIPEVKSVFKKFNGTEEIFYVLEFKEGRKVHESADTKSNIESQYGFTFPSGMSTITAFIPDPTIWKSIEATYNKKSLSYLNIILDRFYNKKCNIIIDDHKVDSEFNPYKYEFISDIVVKDGSKSRAVKFYVNFDVDKNLSIYDLSGSVNSLIVNRGIHIDWIKRIYQDSIKKYFNIQHEYLTAGLKLNVIAMCSNIDFSSQTKERCTKLDNLYIDEVQSYISKQFYSIFRNNEDYFKAHVARLNEYAESITKISAIQKVKQIIGTVDGGNRVRSKLPTNVRDAASNDRIKCELYVVEGKSAASTLIKARNPEFHAILPLRGVPMSTINASLENIMDNEEMCGLITAIGVGVNEYFNIESARYGKIILAGDADSDGYHINSMILGTIAKKMTFLLDEGRVFIASTPLYIQGDKKAYVGDDIKSIIDFKKPFIRAKGHGELNVPEARELFFNESTRRLIQVNSNNLPMVFELLTASYARKELMMDNNIIIDKYDTGIL